MGAGPAKGFGDRAIRVVAREGTMETSGPTELATFAGGVLRCFWGLELAFQRVPGIKETTVGYCQGHQPHPTYEEVCSGRTGHTEAVQVEFYPTAVSYDDLLDVLWDRIDPIMRNGQGNDVGTQYRTGIYYHSEDQKRRAEASLLAEQRKHKSEIATELEPIQEFYPAEDYHQHYLSKGGQCSRKGDLTPIRCYG